MGQFAQEDQEAPRKERKDTWKNCPTEEGSLSPEGCMWRLACRDKLFSNLSPVIEAHFFAKKITWGTQNAKHISTKCDWVEAEVGFGEPRSIPSPPSL